MNPAEAIAANLSRLSYSASLRAQLALRRAANRLTVGEVVKIALVFTFPFFAGQYCYQRALALTEAGKTHSHTKARSQREGETLKAFYSLH